MKYRFFHPEATALNDFEGGFEDYWPWYCEKTRQYKWSGPTSWTVQTFYRLKRAGLDVELTDDLARDGITIGHVRLLPADCRPSRRSMLICIKPDKWFRSQFAHVHIVQNRADRLGWPLSRLWKSEVIPYWPQPSLIPRDPGRTMVQNVDFPGNPAELAPELRSNGFADRVAELGLTFRIRGREHWHDYSDCDLVVGTRIFRPTPGEKLWLERKPASKLVNSWAAGVPAVLGDEPAFRELGTPGADYIQVETPEALLEQLGRLAADPVYYRSFVEAAERNKPKADPARVVEAWLSFLQGTAEPMYARWCDATSWRRAWFFKSREWSAPHLARRSRRMRKAARTRRSSKPPAGR